MVERLRTVERVIAWVRLGGVVFALLEIGVFTAYYPPHYSGRAWVITAVFAGGGIALFWLARVEDERRLRLVGFVALVFDTLVICAYSWLFAFEWGNQTRFALIFAVVEGAMRYGVWGGAALPLALIPAFWFFEWWRVREFHPPGPKFNSDYISGPVGMLLLTGVIIGWLVRKLDERAGEAVRFRDILGRRVDTLEAANRSARALSSSLDLEQAFSAFIREVQGLVPFERTAIVLVEAGYGQTIATAGRGERSVFPPGTSAPVHGSVLERVYAGEVVVRRDLAEEEYPEDRHLLELGLRSELIAPLLVGAKPIGMISLSRTEIDAFTDEEVELVSLLGRIVATTVLNIRAYDSERRTVDELRRLSALRADFVSLVSHELRSPMAAVIGAARTLQERWRTLNPDQREAFLALIGDETTRLAALIGDVLDTSRIEAGTFSYTFSDVDLMQLLEDTVATAIVGQDEVRVLTDMPESLPPIRADRERLRQVLMNLIDNAVKYSPLGDEVAVRARRENGLVRISVSDHGPGIPQDQQRLIFEKFGRADVAGGSKPGTGLGLFIARSIAEAHGGTLEVRSRPDEGATFTLTLPLTP